MKRPKANPSIPVPTIEWRIHFVCGHRVILDNDLAELFGISTKALNQAVRRNSERFPDEFVFQLSKEEVGSLRSQIVTLNEPVAAPVSSSAYVLRSERAIQMSVLIVQTFVRLQRMVVSVDALARKVEELERATVENQNQIKEIIAAIRQLMTAPEKPAREIGFHTRPKEDDPAAPPRKNYSSRARRRVRSAS